MALPSPGTDAVRGMFEHPSNASAPTKPLEHIRGQLVFHLQSGKGQVLYPQQVVRVTSGPCSGKSALILGADEKGPEVPVEEMRECSGVFVLREPRPEDLKAFAPGTQGVKVPDMVSVEGIGQWTAFLRPTSHTRSIVAIAGAQHN